jgi:ATP/maltotriose-dependent transcriptional regulator MalT
MLDASHLTGKWHLEREADMSQQELAYLIFLGVAVSTPDAPTLSSDELRARIMAALDQEDTAFGMRVLPAVSNAVDEARLREDKELASFAKTALEELLLRGHLLPSAEMSAQGLLGLVAHVEGDENSARHLSEVIERWSARADRHFGGVYHVLALLALTVGNVDDAQPHFEDALAFCRKAGYRPELAWTCCDYADLLLERAQSAHPEPVEPRAGSQQDRAKAKSLLDESLAISSELGMRPLVERVKERLGQARAKPGTAPAYPDGLSHREVEVLRLITLGKTNQEIGEELFITARTVANHVTNLLNKTDTANRTEAASYATRHELV